MQDGSLIKYISANFGDIKEKPDKLYPNSHLLTEELSFESSTKNRNGNERTNS